MKLRAWWHPTDFQIGIGLTLPAFRWWWARRKDDYRGWHIKITSGTDAGDIKHVLAYNKLTGTITFHTPWCFHLSLLVGTISLEWGRNLAQELRDVEIK